MATNTVELLTAWVAAAGETLGQVRDFAGSTLIKAYESLEQLAGSVKNLFGISAFITTHPIIVGGLAVAIPSLVIILRRWNELDHKKTDTLIQLQRGYELAPRQQEFLNRRSTQSPRTEIAVIGKGNKNNSPAVALLRNPVGGFGYVFAFEEFNDKGRSTGIIHQLIAETPEAFEKLLFEYDDQARQKMVGSEARRIEHLASTQRGGFLENVSLMLSGFYQKRILTHLLAGNLFRENNYRGVDGLTALRTTRFAGLVSQEKGADGSPRWAAKIYLNPSNEIKLMDVNDTSVPDAIMYFDTRDQAMRGARAYYQKYHFIVRQRGTRNVSKEKQEKFEQDIEQLAEKIMSAGGSASVKASIDPAKAETRVAKARTLPNVEKRLTKDKVLKNAMELVKAMEYGPGKTALEKLTSLLMDRLFEPLDYKEYARKKKNLAGMTTDLSSDFGILSRAVHKKGEALIAEGFKSGRYRPVDIVGTGLAKNAIVVDYSHDDQDFAHSIHAYFDNNAAKTVVNQVDLGNNYFDYERPCGVREIEIDSGANSGETFIVKNPGAWEFVRLTGGDVEVPQKQDYPDYIRDLFDAGIDEAGKNVVLKRSNPATGLDTLYVFKHKVVEHIIEAACKGSSSNPIDDAFIASNALQIIEKPIMQSDEAMRLTSQRGAFVAPYYYDPVKKDWFVLVIKRDIPKGTYGLTGGHLETASERANPAYGALNESQQEVRDALGPVLDLPAADFVPMSKGIDKTGWRGHTEYNGYAVQISPEAAAKANVRLPGVVEETTGGEVEEAKFVSLSYLVSKKGQAEYPMNYPHEYDLVDKLNKLLRAGIVPGANPKRRSSRIKDRVAAVFVIR